jgi:hypothetical protein
MDKTEDLVLREGELANKQADLELKRDLALTARTSAEHRMRVARKQIATLEQKLSEVKEKHRGKPGYARRQRQLKAAQDAFDAAERDLKRANAALDRIRPKLARVKVDLKRVRGNLGDTLDKLSRFLSDTPAGRALGNFLRVFNAAQDAAAGWMVVNAATAAILNNMARPPKGCDEGWTRTLPMPPGVARASAASQAAAGAGAAPAAFGKLRAGKFLPRAQAKAINGLLTLLGSQIRASGESRRKLARLLVKGPAAFRRLASSLPFDPLYATPAVLGERNHQAVVRGLRDELSRLGAGSDLTRGLSPVRGVSSTTAPVDPFAGFKSAELDDLMRRGAAALAP